jgi:hypothetical protein
VHGPVGDPLLSMQIDFRTLRRHQEWLRDSSPSGPEQGVALRHGVEMVLGQASLRFEEAVPIPFRLANCFHSLGRSIEAVTKLTINRLPNPKRKSNAIGAKPEFLPRHYLSVSFCIR